MSVFTHDSFELFQQRFPTFHFKYLEGVQGSLSVGTCFHICLLLSCCPATLSIHTESCLVLEVCRGQSIAADSLVSVSQSEVNLIGLPFLLESVDPRLQSSV